MTLEVHPEVKGLIFDLDGTLSDSLPLHVATWKKVGSRYGFDFDPRIVHELTGRPTIEFAKRIVHRYNLDEEPEKIVGLKQQFFQESLELLQPVAEIVTIMEKYFAKLPMAVGTGASRKSAELQLTALKLNKYFDVIVTADDVRNHKPMPETFLECARLMGVESRFCQVFEDGDLGITAAKEAGMMVTDIRPYINYGEWMNS